MLRRLTQLFVTTALVAAGTLALTAPAAAAGGCTPPPENATLGACIDYSGGSYAQADFYLNVNPDWSRYQYTVWIYQDGVGYPLTNGMPDFTTTGRYCCWHKHVAALPPRWITLRTRVNVYTQAGSFHYAIDSPTITVRA